MQAFLNRGVRFRQTMGSELPALWEESTTRLPGLIEAQQARREERRHSSTRSHRRPRSRSRSCSRPGPLRSHGHAGQGTHEWSQSTARPLSKSTLDHCVTCD